MADLNTEALRGPTPGTPSVIIGLDFGTTYSKVVFADSKDPSELFQVADWPKCPTDTQSVNSQEVPTVLRYLANGEFEWGALVPHNASHEVYKLFKLALEPTMFQKAADTIDKLNVPANVDKIITDYMTGLWNHVLQYVCEHFSCDDLQNAHVVLTVPAIFTDLSKQRTLQAFTSIPNLDKSVTVTLLSEPEAAAISALRELERSSLKEEDTFVVVDAGGGTVDLITYTIAELSPVLEVNEATAGTGDLCGSSLVNLRFEEFLTTRLQNEPAWDTVALNTALDRFENTTKRAFSLASLLENQTYNIPVGGLSRNSHAGIVKTGQFLLKAADIHMFFERYILRIIQLVRNQIQMCNKPVRSIVLTGGFGASTYLRERLQRAINDDTSIKARVEVLQPPNTRFAVARGAVMKGMSQARPENYSIPMVISRTARKHYGYESGVPFNSIVHASLASKKYWDGLFGMWRVEAMVWFIRKGNDVSEDFPFRKSYFYDWPVGTRRTRMFPLTIYADETSSTAPIERSDSVKLLCRLNADMRSIPDDQLDQRLGVDGRMYYCLEFEIEAIYQSASTKYTLIHKDKRYDTVSSEYV
ncbi:hypothetical protein F5Y12DRAFT_792035 [Xylaria sp. FL1777]|nr:hypothetical protein F5Y12DRAFT_792035 [Xylaria sp. FL1777]